MGVLGNLDHERFCQALHVRLWGGEKRLTALPAAYRASVYQGDSADAAIYPNARRLAQRKEVKARLAELADIAGKLAGIDAPWAMLKLKNFVEVNIDDYLTPPDKEGNRYHDIGKVSRDKMGLLAELTQEQWTERYGEGDEQVRGVRKIKIKPHDPLAALALMARIAGWEAPKKVAATNPLGDGPPTQIIEIVRFAEDQTPA